MDDTQKEGYKVIALRWRPKQFDEIVGQEHIVRTLKNAILQNRIAHAFLFVGPRGTGKTTTARIFAKALNCDNGPSITPDDSTKLCQDIMKGDCMDVIEIDGASNNSVDDIRTLRENCQYTPSQAKFKIVILDEVHMLSAGAFNALLKILEEPPAHVKFIFATTEVHKIPATILSRCQRFEFRPIPDEKIVAQLARIAKAEHIDATDEALHSVARLANGGMRDAQSILDQLISFCGNTITEQSVIDVYGLASSAQIGELACALVKGDYAALVALSDTLADEGRDLNRVLVDTQTFLRDALLRAVRAGGTTDVCGVSVRTEQLLRLLDALHAGEFLLEKALSEKVNFETAVLKAAEEGRARPIDSLIRELSDIADALPTEDGKKKIAPPPPSASKPEPPPETAATPTRSAPLSDNATPAPRAAQPAAEAPQPAPAEASAFDDGAPAPVEESAPEDSPAEDYPEARPAVPVAPAASAAPETDVPDIRTPPDADIVWDRVPNVLREMLLANLNATFLSARRFRPDDLH